MMTLIAVAILHQPSLFRKKRGTFQISVADQIKKAWKGTIDMHSSKKKLKKKILLYIIHGSQVKAYICLEY